MRPDTMTTTLSCACCNAGARLAGGERDFVILVGGRRFVFEMHPMCGPAVLTAKGNPSDRQPGPNHGFWLAVTLWGQQGRHVDADGLCIWKSEEIPEVVHLGGRHYALKGSALDPRRVA